MWKIKAFVLRLEKGVEDGKLEKVLCIVVCKVQIVVNVCVFV